MIRRLIALIAFLGCLGVVGFTSAAPLSSEEEWLGITLLGRKMGYSHTLIRPGTGKRTSLAITSDTVIRTALLGQSLEQRIHMVMDVTPGGMPLTSEMTTTSGGKETKVRARFDSAAIHCSVTSGGESSQKVIPIPKGVSLVTDPDLVKTGSLTMGKPITIYFFNPANLSIETATLEARPAESLTVGGITYPARVTVTHSGMGDTTTWQDKDGRTLKVVAMLGMTMLRETREQALSLPADKYEPPADLGKAFAVNPGRPLEDPRAASMLTLRLTAPGLPSPVVDDRQKVERDGPDALRLTVTAKPLTPQGSLTLKQAALAQPEWVKPAPYLPADNAEVKALAERILGGETNAFWASQKLRDWVHRNMTVRADIGVIRSGLDVLKDRRGVCRDFAVLYTTLARAAGLPTRIATGLVYADDAFYYHAWGESYVGRWVDLDPTLPTAFVDATHLKLSHGSAESMLSVARVMGQLKAEVVQYHSGDTSP